MTRDAEEALRDIEGIGGISRILTSGHGKTAPDALATLQSFFLMTKELIEDKPWGLTVLPGSGVNPTTITPILDALLPLGLQEIHLSGSHWIDGGMSFRREGMGMGAGGEGEWGIWMVDREKVSEVREIADKYWESYHGRDE
ncbi:Copper homeostasis protein cutC like protein [Termitomyces sp. T112]|nr:Copper homeostasis protein cutC like protein [Termitomyces sp. T112]